jgi:hypothetical protein
LIFQVKNKIKKLDNDIQDEGCEFLNEILLEKNYIEEIYLNCKSKN